MKFIISKNLAFFLLDFPTNYMRNRGIDSGVIIANVDPGQIFSHSLYLSYCSNSAICYNLICKPAKN